MARYIIGGIIIAVFLVWGGYAFLSTTIQYVPIDQARDSGRTVQVLGKIDFARVQYSAEQSRLEFAIYDAEAVDTLNAERLPVVYHGIVPGNFDQATSVVLKGRGDGEVFEADQILVKCPSKYQGEGDEFQDMKKHQEGVGQAGI